MTDPDHPGLAAAIAEHARIAAGSEHRMLDASCLQPLRRSFDRVTFCDTTEIDTHPFAREANRRKLRIELDRPIVNGNQ